MSREQFPLHWVAPFMESVRPYIHVRRRDRLVIMLPNKAYKFNESGISILEQVLAGTTLEEIVQQAARPEQARQDLYYFFCDFRALVSNCFGDGRGRKAVERIPYEIPFTTLPVLSEIALTYRCNLSCRFCYAGCNCRSMDSREMTTEEIYTVLDTIRHTADVPSVSFTGGEPTLRPDLPELIFHARSIGLRVNLITNGTRIDSDYARKLRQAGLNSAQVSIEGPDATIHDQLTQRPGSFARTVAGINALKDTGIHTQTNTTLNSCNAPVAAEIVKLLHSLGLDRFAMNMLTPSGSAQVNSELYISYSDIGGTVRAVKAAASELKMEFLWYSPTPYCLFNPLKEGLGNKSCAACDGLLSVDPEGNVLPCSSFDEGVGNLFEADFETIWHSAQATFWRHKEYAPDECSGCDSFIACAGACPLYWEACGTSELESPERLEVAR